MTAPNDATPNDPQRKPHIGVLPYGRPVRRRVDLIRFAARALVLIVLIPICVLCASAAHWDTPMTTGSRVYLTIIGLSFIVGGIWFLWWSFKRAPLQPSMREAMRNGIVRRTRY